MTAGLCVSYFTFSALFGQSRHRARFCVRIVPASFFQLQRGESVCHCMGPPRRNAAPSVFFSERSMFSCGCFRALQGENISTFQKSAGDVLKLEEKLVSLRCLISIKKNKNSFVWADQLSGPWMLPPLSVVTLSSDVDYPPCRMKLGAGSAPCFTSAFLPQEEAMKTQGLRFLMVT